MEDSRTMTNNFLRARLLSERSISETAIRRAEELSKKVLELEEQLKFTSIQRKKAEKATADVLAILENHEISDLSDGFDSNSDQDGTVHVFRADALVLREISTMMKARKNELEAYYRSEIESSPSTGRSLSWRSTKHSENSLEKKKHMDSIRRTASFALNGSSVRRAVKSCRAIKRREISCVFLPQNMNFGSSTFSFGAAEEFQNDGLVKATFHVSNCSDDGEADALRDCDNHDRGDKPVDNTMLDSDIGNQKINDHYITVQKREKGMESALQHQAQLIGRYTEEEKAQREWEEKFR